MIGPSVLHGPHQSAQRSTTTGTVMDRSITAVAKVASVTSVTCVSIMVPFTRGRGHNPLLASSNMNNAVIGINESNVTAWMCEHVGATAPLSFELIAGGRSNLTYRVTDATGRSFALRRPPTSHVLPTAHDMVREFTIISALHPLGIPVAQPLGLCIDDDVNERPFYVMEFVARSCATDSRRRRPLTPQFVASSAAISLRRFRNCTMWTSKGRGSPIWPVTTGTLSANCVAGGANTTRCR